jgi:hypothetical protein
MTHEGYDHWAIDPVLMTVEEIKTRIYWLNEMLKQLRPGSPTPKEAKH